MALTFGLASINDLYEKLQRDALALNAEITSDGLFNFVVTGYSMIDWVKNDPTVPSTAKTPSSIQKLYGDRWLKICGDLVTASKHFKLDKRTPITSSVKSLRGFGMGRHGEGGYGVGEEDIEVWLNDGTHFRYLDLVQCVLASWQAFFSIHQI